MPPGKEVLMNNQCPFKNAGRCDIWLDYQVSLYELKEAEELASANWKEIQYLYSKVEQLKNMLKEAGLPLPDEY